jgi:hypothetical protein
MLRIRSLMPNFCSMSSPTAARLQKLKSIFDYSDRTPMTMMLDSVFLRLAENVSVALVASTQGQAYGCPATFLKLINRRAHR